MDRICEAIIFDMDGTLLDTETLAWRSWQLSIAEAGVSFPEDFYPSIIGRTRKDYIERIREAISHPDKLDALLEAMPRNYQKVITRDGLPLRPGVRETLEWLARQEIPLAVATSTGRDWAERKLAQSGIAHYFRSLTAGDEIAHGKPAPDIFLEALRRIGFTAGQCLAVEDSPNGLQAAVAAGLRTILVPDMAPVPTELLPLAWRRCQRVDELIGLLSHQA